MNPRRFHRAFLLPGYLLLLAWVWGCAGPQVREEPKAPPPPPPVVAPPKPTGPPPVTLDLLSGALDRLGKTLGIEFYRNSKGRYMPYALLGREKFSIADKTGNCLYEISVLPRESRRDLRSDPDQPELDLMPGPCGLVFPDIDAEAGKSVVTSETDRVYPALVTRLDSAPSAKEASVKENCSDRDFIEQVLSLPYHMDVDTDNSLESGSSLESWLIARAEAITDPFDLSFGDIVALDDPAGKTLVGLYTGHGIVVHGNACEPAGLHRMTSDNNYRAYRLVSGFAWTRHRIHNDDFLKRYAASKGASHGQAP